MRVKTAPRSNGAGKVFDGHGFYQRIRVVMAWWRFVVLTRSLRDND